MAWQIDRMQSTINNRVRGSQMTYLKSKREGKRKRRSEAKVTVCESESKIGCWGHLFSSLLGLLEMLLSANKNNNNNASFVNPKSLSLPLFWEPNGRQLGPNSHKCAPFTAASFFPGKCFKALPFAGGLPFFVLLSLSGHPYRRALTSLSFWEIQHNLLKYFAFR